MKKLNLLTIAVFMLMSIFICIPAHAGDVTFAWDPNSETNLAGYKMYTTSTSGTNYSLMETIYLSDLSDVSSPQFTISVTGDYVHYFVLTAFDTDGLESDFSEEVSYEVNENPPLAPSNYRILGQ